MIHQLVILLTQKLISDALQPFNYTIFYEQDSTSIDEQLGVISVLLNSKLWPKSPLKF